MISNFTQYLGIHIHLVIKMFVKLRIPYTTTNNCIEDFWNVRDGFKTSAK